MSDPGKPVPIPTAERRDAIVAKLSDAFASSRIELEDFEQRMERAMRAQTVPDLDATLDGLTSPATPLPAANPPEFNVDHPRRHASHVTFVVMGGVDRKGRWTPARRHVALAWMGGAFLDFREAALQPGITNVYCFAKWGGIEVAVPPGLDVEVSGIAIMGGLERVSQESASTNPRRPQLHIHALAIMGAIEVRVLKVGEKWGEGENDEDDNDDGRR